jgi:hypothetical protein
MCIALTPPVDPCRTGRRGRANGGATGVTVNPYRTETSGELPVLPVGHGKVPYPGAYRDGLGVQLMSWLQELGPNIACIGRNLVLCDKGHGVSRCPSILPRCANSL